MNLSLETTRAGPSESSPSETPSTYAISNGWHETPWPVQKVVLLVLEIASIYLATTILVIGSSVFIPLTSRNFYTIVTGPILEEVCFRGIMQNGIRLGQTAWNWRRGQEPTQAQLAFRVRITALTFGAIHLLNPGALSNRIFQSVAAGIGGVAYGYLAEITGTLATTILLHGLHNGLCVAGHMATASQLHLVALIFLLELSNHYVVHHGGYLSTFRHLTFQINTWTDRVIDCFPSFQAVENASPAN